MRVFPIIALLAASAATVAPAQQVPIALNPGEVLLNVQAEGETKSKPDVMSITAGVVTTGATAREALRTNSELAQKLIDAVGAAGVQAKDVQTSELSVVPQFEQLDERRVEGDDRGRRQPRIIGYVASNKVELQLRDLRRAPDMIDAFFAAGANSVQGPVFDLTDSKQAQALARTDAVRSAGEQAQTYADALGMKVVRVLRVSERNVETERFANILVTGSRIPRTPVEPGDLTTRSTVWVDYALAPR